MEEDSGYFSRRSADFTFASSSSAPGSHAAPASLPSSSFSSSSADDLFCLSFHDLPSSKYHYLRHGFRDEEDFEEFKRELREFRRLKREARGGGSGGGGDSGGGQWSEDDGCSSVDRGERRGGTLAEIGKVSSDTALGERGDGEGAERAESPGEGEGGRVGGGGDDIPRESRRWSAGECDPPRQPSTQVNTAISFREGSGGGGARAKEAASRRNGVYFEEGCVVDGSPHPRADWKGEREQQQQQQCREVDNKPERGSSGTVRGVNNIPGDVSFSAKAGEKRGSVGEGGGGLKRVSFRETPERFSLEEEETPVRLSAEKGDVKTSSVKHETDVPSRPSVLKPESKSYAQDRSDFDWEFFKPGSYASRGKLNTARKTLSVDDPTSFAGGLSRGEGRDVCGLASAHQTWPSLSAGGVTCRERSQPIQIPIRIVSVPVSRSDSSSRVHDIGSFSHDGHVLVDKELTPGKVDSALPPRDPTSVRSGVENRKEKDRSAVGDDPLNVHGNVTDKQDPEDSQRVSRDRVTEEDRQCADTPRHGPASHPKRSSLLESLRRLSGHGRPRSGRGAESWMDLFGGDDSFQEFERVFETINSHRDLDMRRPGGWWRDDGSGKDPGGGGGGDDDGDLGILHIDEDFLDFFDHDEDFMEFERELENIKSNRRSKLLENLQRRSSSCDIFEDVKAFCDRSLNRNGTPSSSPKVERRLSATNSADTALWNSAEEWGLVLNKLRRNSRLLSDQALNSDRAERGDSDGRTEVDYVSRNRTLPAAFTGREPAGRPHQGARAKDCQYTCHLSCVPSVTLDCTTVSPGSGGGPVATPTDLPSPSNLPSPSASAETSLIERRTIVPHRSPQKQPCAVASPRNSAAQTASPSVQHLAPPSSTGTRSSSPSSAFSSIRDPLSGACVTSSTSLSSSGLSTLGSSSVCVEKDLNQNAKNIDGGGVLPELRLGDDVGEASTEKDETDSGYRSGTIPEEKLPKAPSQATLNRMELRRKIQSFNHFVPSVALEQKEDGESFQGFLRVTLNLIRPITMELGARPPSIYELLTREHIVEQSTQHVAFYMPRDTVKSIHISSKTTTKEVVKNLLKKFHILDHPRKFAMYEQEFNEKNKLVKLRRLTDKDCPLVSLLLWEPERVKHYRLVLQENETGEIVWENFSEPELKNFQIVLDREENEAIAQLQYKYRVMKRIILQRMKELRQEKQTSKESRA